jgi:hypothetical protein
MSKERAAGYLAGLVERVHAAEPRVENGVVVEEKADLRAALLAEIQGIRVTGLTPDGDDVGTDPVIAITRSPGTTATRDGGRWRLSYLDVILTTPPVMAPTPEGVAAFAASEEGRRHAAEEARLARAMRATLVQREANAHAIEGIGQLVNSAPEGSYTDAYLLDGANTLAAGRDDAPALLLRLRRLILEGARDPDLRDELRTGGWTLTLTPIPEEKVREIRGTTGRVRLAGKGRRIVGGSMVDAAPTPGEAPRSIRSPSRASG